MICHYAEWNYAECRIFFSFMLSVIVLSVVMLNVAMLSVVAPSEWPKTTSFLSLLGSVL
jgi:hypothetical protein